MFRLPTPRLLSGLKSALRPAMPRFKVSAFWLLILAWIFLLVWIWWKGPTWTLYEEQWLKPLANRWLATAAWGIIALMWLTVRVMKRLQQLEKMQKQQREEAVDPLSVELNAQQPAQERHQSLKTAEIQTAEKAVAQTKPANRQTFADGHGAGVHGQTDGDDKQFPH